MSKPSCFGKFNHGWGVCLDQCKYNTRCLSVAKILAHQRGRGREVQYVRKVERSVKKDDGTWKTTTTYKPPERKHRRTKVTSYKPKKKPIVTPPPKPKPKTRMLYAAMSHDLATSWGVYHYGKDLNGTKRELLIEEFKNIRKEEENEYVMKARLQIIKEKLAKES